MLSSIAKSKNACVLFFLFIAAFSFAFYYPVARVAAVAAFALILLALRNKIPNAYASQSGLWVLAYVTFVALAVTWSCDPEIGFRQLGYALPWTLLPAAVSWLIAQKNRSSRMIAWGLLLGGGIFTAWALLIVFGPLPPYSNGHSGLRYFYNSGYLYVAHSGGLFALLYLYLSMRSLRFGNKTWATVWLIAGALALILLFSLEGRGGQVAFIAAFLVMIAGLSRSHKKTVALLLSVATTTVIVGFAYLSSNIFQNRVQESTVDVRKISEGDLWGSWGQRLAMWELGLEAWRQKPFFGHGTGATTAIGEILQKDKKELVSFIPEMWKRHLHNQYIETLKQHGLVGLFLVLGMFWSFFKSVRPENRLIAAVVLTHLAVANMSNSMLLRYDVAFSIVILFALFSQKPFEELVLKSDKTKES